MQSATSLLFVICNKDSPVLCSYDLSLWSRMDRPLANDSQRSEQIVVLARIRTRESSTIIHAFGHGNSLMQSTHSTHVSIISRRVS